MRDVDLEKLLASNTTPATKKAEREDLAKQVAEWEAAGNEIKQIPGGEDEQ